MGEIVKGQVLEAGCLVVGSGVTVKGTFSVPGRATVNGSLEGRIAAEEMHVGPSGCIAGTVQAAVIDVRGAVHEKIRASRALVLRATGTVTGSIAYAELVIEKGARLSGTLTILEEPSGPAEDTPAQLTPARASVEA